jgi:hypothetical protein
VDLSAAARCTQNCAGARGRPDDRDRPGGLQRREERQDVVAQSGEVQVRRQAGEAEGAVTALDAEHRCGRAGHRVVHGIYATRDVFEVSSPSSSPGK